MNRLLKNFRFSLKIKIALVFLLLVFVMMITVGYIFTIRELNLQVEQVKVRMERLARNIATIRSVETEDWNIYQTYVDNQIIVNPDIIYIAIFNEQGELKVHALNTAWLELDLPRALTKYEQANIVLRLDQRQIAEESQRDIESKSVNIIVGDQNLGTVNIGFSLVDLNDEMRRNLLRNSLVGAIFVVLAMLIAFFTSSRIVNPLGKLTHAMKKISQGDLKQEINIRSHDEIGEMANTFNFMAKELQEKEVIENFNRELAFTIELEKLASLITERITAALNARQSYFFLREQKEADRFQLVVSYPMPANAEIYFSKKQLFCEEVIKNRSLFQLQDLKTQATIFDSLTRLAAIKEDAFFCPFIIKNKVMGFLVLSHSKNNVSYSANEIKFLETLIGQGSFAIENALLYEELTEQERLKRELEVARRVQLGLLPQKAPAMPGLDIDGICIPATEIGGDYFDYFKINDHTLGIVVADVAGKGTSAAFYMAVIKGMMLSLTSVYSSPAQLMSELNRRIFGTMDRKVFITMIYATIDLRKSVLRFARAGHQALIMMRSKNSHIEAFTPKGIGIGLTHDRLFDQHISEGQLHLQLGDILLFYTDGISDAMNDDLKEFGEQRLIKVLSRQKNKMATQIREGIIAAVKDFVQDEPQYDDITLVTIKAT